jgi:predicted small lipoprotein YifL
MLKNIRLIIIACTFAIIGCGALVACGTKGPLYIPEQRYPQKESSQEEAVQKSVPQDGDIKANPEANTNEAPPPAQ